MYNIDEVEGEKEEEEKMGRNDTQKYTHLNS